MRHRECPRGVRLSPPRTRSKLTTLISHPLHLRRDYQKILIKRIDSKYLILLAIVGCERQERDDGVRHLSGVRQDRAGLACSWAEPDIQAESDDLPPPLARMSASSSSAAQGPEPAAGGATTAPRGDAA